MVDDPNFSLEETFSVRSKLVAITGAAGGIGKALCAGFSKMGANVVAIDRQELVGMDVEATVSLDVADEKAVIDACRQIEAKIGRVDVLINNAGIGGSGRLHQHTSDTWDRVLNTNLKGAFFLARAFAPSMIARQSGKIINICSPCGVFGFPFAASYNASKAGLWSLTQTMAVEWSKYNIQSNAIVPNFVKTPMTQSSQADPREMAIHASLIPAGRVSIPSDLVGPALFLASPASNYVSGTMLMVDGGASAAGGFSVLTNYFDDNKLEP